MAVFAMQPVIAMHYCGGELKSLDLFARQTVTSTDRAGRGDNHSCCNSRTSGDSHKAGNPRTTEDSRRAETARHGDELHFTGDKCCNTEILELTTDDYQSKITQQDSRLLSFSIGNAGAIPIRPFKLPEPETGIRTPLHYFPPGGLFLKNVSILTYICIYRI
jgi:hypothetical protein